MTRESRPHDHRKWLWIISGGRILWCSSCGAWRDNCAGRRCWQRPTYRDARAAAERKRKADV